MPTLDENARTALRVIYTRGMIRGRDVQRLAKLTPDALRQALKTLAARNFVTISSDEGLASDAGASDAYVAPLRSKAAEAQYEMDS